MTPNGFGFHRLLARRLLAFSNWRDHRFGWCRHSRWRNHNLLDHFFRAQRSLHGVNNDNPNLRGISKPDFTLSWMDIYINERWIHRKPEPGRWLKTITKRALKSFAQGTGNHRVFHRASVEKDVLVLSSTSSEVRRKNSAFNHQSSFLVARHFDQRSPGLRTCHRFDSNPSIGRCR